MFNKDSLQDVIAQRTGGTPAENKWYGRGVIEALRERVDSMPDLASQPNVLRSVAGSRAARAKLEAAVPDRRVAALRARLADENTAAQTSNFVRSGSQTADKAVEAADAAVDMAADVAVSSPTQTVVRGLQSAYAQVMKGVNAETRAEVARQLTNFNDPAAQQAFLERLRRLQAQGQLRAQDVTATARAMAAQTQTE
jgi:hypothetical protein